MIRTSLREPPHSPLHQLITGTQEAGEAHAIAHTKLCFGFIGVCLAVVGQIRGCTPPGRARIGTPGGLDSLHALAADKLFLIPVVRAVKCIHVAKDAWAE